MKVMTDKQTIDRIVNRHMARTLENLEDAGCPDLFIKAVKSSFVWLRGDLSKIQDEDSADALQNQRSKQ